MEQPLNIKDKNALNYIAYLKDRLSEFTSSPYKDSYLALKKMIDKGNSQLVRASETSIDFDSKEFNSISAFIKNQKVYCEQMEFFRSKMSPEEARKMEQENQSRNLGLAEKMALKNKK